MALTGELSDLSLAELIEFFCNQRKTGRLKVVYPNGPGYFYLQSGSVVHARIGVLAGIDAVYYALTLPNASFTFSPAFEAPEHTINQPWTSVVLEGLRRMDEGIAPRAPFPHPESKNGDEKLPSVADRTTEKSVTQVARTHHEEPKDYPVDPSIEVRTFSRDVASNAQRRSRWSPFAVVSAVVMIIAAIGVPWGWYAHSKAAKLANESRAVSMANVETPASPAITDPSAAASDNSSETPQSSSETEQPNTSLESDFAKRQREARAKERAKLAEASSATSSPGTKENTPAVNSSAVKPAATANNGGKRVTVQVTYDENGRVTQASGGDATALRIARQKRFPAGKAGSATVTIPIN